MFCLCHYNIINKHEVDIQKRFKNTCCGSHWYEWLPSRCVNLPMKYFIELTMQLFQPTDNQGVHENFLNRDFLMDILNFQLKQILPNRMEIIKISKTKLLYPNSSVLEICSLIIIHIISYYNTYISIHLCWDLQHVQIKQNYHLITPGCTGIIAKYMHVAIMLSPILYNTRTSFVEKQPVT